MHLNIYAQTTPSPQYEGLWRLPSDRTADGYRSLEHWMSVARQLEGACIDALFFADFHGMCDIYRNSWEPAVRHAVNIPAIDPVLVIPAAAAVTRHLGFAVTYSTTYHPPYECARLFSSLDHLTDGRIGWNIVTSYLRSATANGLGEYLEHDLRYERADEYMQVVRALWERSWDDDAVVRDAANDTFSDPTRVHQIDHHGVWYSVEGPHQCEPSPQRTPVLYQAGASKRGMAFAAKHAEVVFLSLPDPVTGAGQVAELRRHVEDFGRDPRSVKALQGAMVLLGRTEEDAKAVADACVQLWSNEGHLTRWCVWTDTDLGSAPDETPVAELEVEGTRSFVDLLTKIDPERVWTVADIKEMAATMRRPDRKPPAMLYGSVEQVADRMEEWLGAADIDGFNLIPCPTSAGIDDICQHLIPELQRRGLFRTEYDPSERTLRERYYGAGVSRYAEAVALSS